MTDAEKAAWRAGARSYNHSVRRIGPDHWRVYWTVDFRYPGSRLRHPRTFSRDTDIDGALRFTRRWNVTLPVLRETTP